MRSPISTLWALLPILAHTVAAAPGAAQKALTFEPAGDAGISAQMMFLGSKTKVYILDKTENNPTQINGKYGTHPAWAVEYDINTQQVRTMDVFSNTFCACGAVMANGTWAVFGGNQPVTTGGVATNQLAAYSDMTGGTAIRMLTPSDDGQSEYVQGEVTLDITKDTGGYLQMTGKRWYPTVETLPDGSLIVIGGDKNGGYVNTAGQDNPTYEFFPPNSQGAVHLQLLSDTLPINLYPLVWLMPSGQLFIQSGAKSYLYDYNSQQTTNLPDMPYAARVYPASAATAMLPLTPENNYDPTILFCGGSNVTQWGNDGGPGYNVTAMPADASCVRFAPNQPGAQYENDDWMMEGRSMGQFVILPDDTFFHVNGVAMGTAGYGDQKYSVGESFGQDPIYMPTIYNPNAPAGARWNRTGLSPSPNERMYHSTAVLLPDGSVLISGSNPNADFTNNQWRSRTDVERWYPWYYDNTRPTYTGRPESLSYGGNYFNLTLDTTDETAVNNTKVVILRGGFNTHAIAFGQRSLHLKTSYTIDRNSNTATLHVSQMPGTNGPNIFQPGPALIFVVQNGVPSEGEFVMIGTGELGTQPTAANQELPASTVIPLPNEASSSSTAGTTGSIDSHKNSGAVSLGGFAPAVLVTLGLALAPVLLM
ncbi:hypothetical protein Q8F55_005586 [Vanrija albida]|uniref:Glyoxal oxidase n=1 Tax=Vanrija albida TaxID=181172 RepID=A0ABR3Q222_9TREE